MLKYAIRRIIQIIPILLGVSLVVFAIVHLIPGDPAQVILGQKADQATILEFRHLQGLDKPLITQYFIFLNKILHGNLGISLATQRAIAVEIWPHLAATAELTIFSMTFAVIVGVNLGIFAAWKRNSWVDYVAMILALVGVSMPVFWLGLMEQWVFGILLHWLPVVGRADPRDPIQAITNFYILDTLIKGNFNQLFTVFFHLFLPGIALGTIPMAIIARMTRSSMLEYLQQDYIRTARAKGLSEFVVVYKHTLKNSFAPVLTVIGLQLGSLLSGAVLTETIFGWPGVGLYLYQAIDARDYPVIQSGVLILSVVFIVVNLIVDLLYAYFDPRIEYR